MGSVNLSEQPVTATPYGRWQQLNAALNVNAFGINAVICEPGEDIGIEHDESETGQQEAYIVVSGRAAFTVGEERIEAGPGTVVAAPDPAATRGFEALEPNTRIVCVGAAPAAEAQPYGEWIAEAATG
jgi:mannose-6-phosphate isomerase-like protein (cupin superfamily)